MERRQRYPGRKIEKALQQSEIISGENRGKYQKWRSRVNPLTELVHGNPSILFPEESTIIQELIVREKEFSNSKSYKEDLSNVLSPSEFIVLNVLKNGGTNQLIGKKLSISEDTVKNHITSILRKMGAKGIGQWTAEMFLMFAMGRPDVFSFGDLGIRKGIQKLYNLKKEPTEKQALKIAEKWRPYRTVACRYIWKSLEQK